MSLSAIDALQRGLLNLRANKMLLVMQIVQGLVLAILGFAGLAPVVLAVGGGAMSSLYLAAQEGWGPSQSAELGELFEQTLEDWPLLLAAVLAAFAVWTVAFLVYCWIQAGVMSQLAAGEQAATGAAQPSVGDFRVYSWPAFTRAAASRVWKIFWLVNLIALVGLTFLLVAVVALSLTLAVSGRQDNFAAALAVGCLSIVAVFVVFFFLFAWTGVAKAELVVGGGGVLEASRHSLRLLWRRLGAVLLLLVLFIAGSLAVAVVFAPLSLVFDLALGDSMSRQIAADVGLSLFQTPFNAALIVVLSAALVALVRGER